MKASNTCINLIKRYEGYADKAYLCPANVWTIGYGTIFYPSGKPVCKGDVCNKEQALQYLTNDLAKFEDTIRKTKAKLSQSEFDALVSFVYNLGSANYNTSTLKKRLEAGEVPSKVIPQELPKWCNGGGKYLFGLMKRRVNECALALGLC